jgi:exodeoxyribonuclease V beta subunit
VRPPELDELDLGVGTVIEASAGTGKTYLLEHLVLELVLTGRARLEEILVVTFTERATAELLARIRAKIDQALACTDEGSSTDGSGGGDGGGGASASASATRPGGWRLDGLARQRLFAARASLDRAAVSTIHAFCQRILIEEPFSTKRLLHQTQTDGRRLFSELFRDRLRCRFATEPAFVDYLDTYLDTVQTTAVERLEALLYRAFAAQQASPEAVVWDSPYDERALDEVMRTLVALRCDSAPMAAAFKAMSRRRRNTRDRLEEAIQVARRCLDEGTRAPFLAHLDGAETFVAHLGDLDAVPDDDPALGPLARVARAILDHAPTLDEAVVQTLLPEIARAVAQRKRDEGLFDFDDMITALAEAVEAPGGAGLVGRIRARYRVALIDEAQDTSPAQWRVFRRCFLDSGGTHPLVLVGDPKQAIYGFRGADVRTFLGAADQLVARGGRRTVLSVNHRSYAEVVDAYNAICGPTPRPDGSGVEGEPREPGALSGAGASAPFFTGGVTYAHPVRSARGALSPGGAAPGITLFKLDFEAKTRRIGHVRAALRAGMVRAILRLWRGPPSISIPLAGEAAGPRAEDHQPPPGVSLSEIFVLTRTNGESAEMAEALREAGIPNALYKPDHLFETPEAEHLRRLLAAIADPTDRVARFQAWLTPFFGIPLAELGRVPNPEPGHPALRRLGAWHALAAERRFDLLWPAILHDSGVTRRLRLSPFSQRRLANYRQLIDVLVAEAGQSARSISDLVALLGSLQARRRQPTGSLAEGRGIQKVETEEPAVQILTIHKAKGLEADHVFVYGALRAGPGAKRKVSVLHRGRERVLVTGLPRRSARSVQIAEEAEEEDQRLMYVALTRARKHVYLPYVSRLGDGDGSAAQAAQQIGRELVERDDEFLKKLTGAYRLVNHRLVHLAASFPAEFGRCFRIEPCPVLASVGTVPVPPESRSPPSSPPSSSSSSSSVRDLAATDGQGDCLARLAAWRPSADLLAPALGAGVSGGPGQAVDVAARRGFEVTSYSRLKQSGGGYVRPVGLGAGAAVQSGGAGEAQGPAEDELRGEAAAARSGQPRGGIDAGLFLHALLEKVPLPVGGSPAAPGRRPFAPLSEWSARPEIQELFDAEARRWQRTPEEVMEALAMVHAALGQPLALPVSSGSSGSPGRLGPSVPSGSSDSPVERAAVGSADRIRREVEFVFPLPRGAGQARGPEPGFVRGVLDVLFEHQGRIYLADWKSDRLPDYGAATVAEHAARNYALQVQLYVLAVLRMLGIAHEADYERRFGGWVYVFLRGLVPLVGPLPADATSSPASATGVTQSDRPAGAGDRGTWIGRPTWGEVQVWQEQLPHLLSPIRGTMPPTARGGEDWP